MSLFDPARPYLEPALWTPDRTVIPKIKEYLISLLEKIFPMEKVFSMNLIGSIVGYQYSETSDIDINVMARAGEEFDYWHPIFKRFNETPNYLPGTKHPINFFFQPYTGTLNWDNSLGAYNMLTDTWEKKPIPYDKVGDPLVKYEREINYARVLLSMLDSEVQLINAAKARKDLDEVQRREFDLAVLFKTIEDNRKTAYRYGTGTPALQECNIVYKFIEDSPHAELFHQLINKYDQHYNTYIQKSITIA
jgi:hypothetical protein